MTSDKREWTQSRDALVNAITSLGYPVEFGKERAKNLGSPKAMYRMTDESCVQVANYDDRSEVTSPGGLYNRLTFEDMMHGHSKLRNRAIANVFSQMGLVESWGTGIKKIIDSAKVR